MQNWYMQKLDYTSFSFYTYHVSNQIQKSPNCRKNQIADVECELKLKSSLMWMDSANTNYDEVASGCMYYIFGLLYYRVEFLENS